jgi:nitrogen-specific signal transduction histidine kinase
VNLHQFRTGTRHVNIVKTPLRNMNGETIGLLGIARDISELKKMEAELAAARAAEALSSVARPVAHDFNNALAAINGYATLIDDDLAETSPIKKEISLIIQAVKRAAELTSRFQDFARNPKLGGHEDGK